MNKIKFIRKKDNIRFVLKSEKGQALNENEIYSVNNNMLPGLLHMEAERRKNSFQITYNATNFISFKEFLVNPMTKDAFAGILNNITETLAAVEKLFLRKECLYLDYDFVTVNPLTQQIYFIYVPIQGIDCGFSLREFLLSIVHYTSFDSYEDNGYIKEYISILNNGINLSEFDLREFVGKLYGQQISSKYKEYMSNLNKTPPTSITASKASEKAETAASGIYDPFSAAVEASGAGFTQSNTGKTVFLGNSDSEETVFLGTAAGKDKNSPYLIREKNREKIWIVKDNFRLGKKGDFIDYCIKDNNAISRSHAVILTKNDRYYIMDLDSTNKTFVNDFPVSPNCEVEIFDGTDICLANEKFTFKIEK
ncbi:MAG: FHA domain-containing protein [Firmicutes bacterium]|nr:FHA domain-containing protein [[Eubacterium] siraeum]MCM1487898.1 FHA domain-containing protein [Bacillota bacterium]